MSLFFSKLDKRAYWCTIFQAYTELESVLRQMAKKTIAKNTNQWQMLVYIVQKKRAKQ